MGLNSVLSDLESAGYEVEPPLIIPACGLNAPHRRYRVWVVAHSINGRPQERRAEANGEVVRCSEIGKAPVFIGSEVEESDSLLCHSKRGGFSGQSRRRTREKLEDGYVESDTSRVVTHSKGERKRGDERDIYKAECGSGGSLLQWAGGTSQGDVSDAPKCRLQRGNDSFGLHEKADGEWSSESAGVCCGNELFEPTDFQRLTTTDWLLESTFRRSDDGISCGLDGAMIPGVTTEKIPNRAARLKAIGNAVVPQIPELIGMAIMEIERKKYES